MLDSYSRAFSYVKRVSAGALSGRGEIGWYRKRRNWIPGVFSRSILSFSQNIIQLTFFSCDHLFNCLAIV